MEWCEIKLPLCVKKILIFSAYECANSLRLLNEEKIVEIEKYVSDFGRSIIDELNCCHSEKYRNQRTFKFLPGHRSLLMSHVSYAKKISEINFDKKVADLPKQCDEPYSVVLREWIKSAQINSKKPKNQASYSDVIRYFCTFVYLTGGRASYDILQRNLPIPSTKTIRKCSGFIEFM